MDIKEVEKLMGLQTDLADEVLVCREIDKLNRIKQN
jgi:hypothetical protein